MVKSTDQITSAILESQENVSNEDVNPSHTIQKTVIVPNRSTPVNKYSDPLLWLNAYQNL